MVEILHGFVDKHADAMAKSMRLKRQCQEMWEETQLYFSLDEELDTPQKFFQLFHAFFEMMDHANEENRKKKTPDRTKTASVMEAMQDATSKFHRLQEMKEEEEQEEWE